MIKQRIRGISFVCDEETGRCRIFGAGEDITKDNPLEAFNMFWERAGNIVRNEIRDAIEKNGFNRYLGVKMGKKMPFEAVEKLSGVDNNKNERMFLPANKYGYTININHPKIRPLYEQFKREVGCNILSDNERRRFEMEILQKIRKKEI